MAKRSMKSVLIEAREYISNRRNWYQGGLASKRATKHGYACAPTDKGAKVCALGAVSRVLGTERYPHEHDSVIGKKLEDRLDKAAKTIARREGLDSADAYGIVNLNDVGSRAKAHERVLAAFDLAIGK